MADIRCQMCGKPNPAAAEVCQFCQARLKPLVKPPPPEDDPRGSASSSQGADALGWLSDFKFDDSSPVEAAPSIEDPNSGVTDWLTRLSQVEEDTSPVQIEPTPRAEPLPDWLSTPMDKGDPNVPDWMEEMKISSAQEAGTAEEPVPDWLQRVRSLQQGAPSAETAEESALPSWLTGNTEDQLSEAQPDPHESNLPDWLSAAQGGQAAPAQTGDEFPGWLGAESDAPAAEPTSAGAVPDWLTGDEPPGVKPFASGEWGDDAEASPAPAEEAVQPSDDWLSAAITDTGSTSSGVAAFVLDNEEDQAFLFGDEVAFPSELGATPDWLSQAAAGSTAESAEIEAEEQEIAPAQLPSWLEAMRPVEAAALPSFKDESDTRVEGAGPLSGLQGVLQAEPDSARSRKPPVYSNKLDVTETHQAYLNLLQEMVQNEGQAVPVIPRPLVSAQPLLRWAATLLLLAVVIFQLWPEGQLIPLAAQGAPSLEVVAFNGSMNSARTTQPILIAVEYEPALSGELSFPMRAIVEQLKSKDTPLVTVSTSLNGPYLTRQMLGGTISETMITNLGYLPAGSAGLRAFASDPLLAAPYAFDSALTFKFGETGMDKGWNAPALSNVRQLNDFALIIVCTDNADTARTWVEQIGPALKDTPLLMVLSAQAAPLVRPYFPQQVQGILAGIEGAAAYQSLHGAPSTPWKVWDAYGAGLLVAVVLILGGGLANLFSSILANSKRRKAGE